MKFKLRLVFSIILLLRLSLSAQVLPPIQSFSPEVYGADNQNWAIAQTSDKLIYVANNKGLLEFNGETWKLYDSPNGKMRSVAVIKDKIYTGCYKNFGFWQKDSIGDLNYKSISERLKVQFLEDEEVWNIIGLDDWVLFQSLNRIYIYNTLDESYDIIDSNTIIHKIFKVEGVVYFQKVKEGLYKIEGGKPVLVSDETLFKESFIVNIFKHENSLLVETEAHGFYVLSEDQSISKWDIPDANVISQLSVYRSKKLSTNSYILGTRSNGIFHLSEKGKIDYSIDFSNGLLSNSIHYVFEDSEHNIWLALENGINCINVKSPFSFYHDKEGKIGTTYASIIHKDVLYLGTNQGLFYKDLDDSSSEFKFVSGTEGPVWCLVSYQNTLFCGHNLGTFIIDNKRITSRIDVHGTWNLIPIPGKENQLLKGNYDGLSVIELKNDRWQLRNKIDGFNTSCKFFEIQEDNIFVSHEYKGVFKLKIDKDFTKVTDVSKDITVDKGIYSSLVKYDDKILYTYQNGVYAYNNKTDQFVKDTLLSHLFEKESYTSGKLISDKKNKMLWGFSRKKLNYVTPGKLSEAPNIESIPFSESLPHGLAGSENISHLYNENYLIGTSDGYIILDLSKIRNRTYNVTIGSILLSSQDEEDKFFTAKTSPNEFKSKYNNIAFTFSIPEYNKYLDTEYQYKLNGFYDSWSNWSSSPTVLFKNLPFGDYEFSVRAKVGHNVTENIETYTFTIKRPWYLTRFMIFLYVCIALIIILVVHAFYRRYYKKQRERLMRKTERELELKELENKQQLMRFNNEKLRQDIDSKSRELGMSTMNLIKKNELLGRLKTELQSVKDLHQLKNVINIIDKNLNNNDDWNLFEEAFNNADKDFLKKIKSMHPELTTNDLRLCTYLRLNLSSKEIAPLLNISPRSVEVKRYRLRKKLKLAHESSLTDYILEI
ncbi:triple tyrosine motif-containing protein [Seonamhaeicola marinus]|uniref:LuxR family transcriptional regulator n=1 Tax=Seonamhaeicola marinus TaxID=1912246 RepID=A0A5D0IMT0_9FLAO|nr:triple tyrosine motif-containing protein [Seonamhaeicola marinus]TYA84329.1 LuxR family transcriptional regulator [Seonamhaeicola marinus]